MTACLNNSGEGGLSVVVVECWHENRQLTLKEVRPRPTRLPKEERREDLRRGRIAFCGDWGGTLLRTVDMVGGTSCGTSVFVQKLRSHVVGGGGTPGVETCIGYLLA